MPSKVIPPRRTSQGNIPQTLGVIRSVANAGLEVAAIVEFAALTNSLGFSEGSADFTDEFGENKGVVKKVEGGTSSCCGGSIWTGPRCQIQSSFQAKPGTISMRFQKESIALLGTKNLRPAKLAAK